MPLSFPLRSTGSILVALSGKTPRETLQHAKEALSQVNAKVLGVVINRVDLEKARYGYYYYRYHYYYGYGKKHDYGYGNDKKRKKEISYTGDRANA